MDGKQSNQASARRRVAQVNFDYDPRGFECVCQFASLSLHGQFYNKGLLADQTLGTQQTSHISSRQYEYDAAGIPTKKTDAQWGTTGNLYGELERILRTLHPDDTI